jgi:methylase of polypeptide subunit release factors
MTAGMLPSEVVDRLAEAVHDRYHSAAQAAVLGLAGEAALSRSDLAAVDRLTRGGSPAETLIRLFRLGLPVDAGSAGDALAPLPVADAVAAGLVEPDPDGGGRVRAALSLQLCPDQDRDCWVLSDLPAELRGGRLRSDHVLGVGAAARTLAQATVRHRVGSALDVGTGCGVQALGLSRHSGSVTGTDLSERALAFAASTARLNGLRWRLLAGSLLEPVAGECFDLIVCNPPFIVGPGYSPDTDGYHYRDSGLAGDQVCATLVAGLPDRLAIGGTAQLLANWVIDLDQPWPDRVAGWLPAGCDGWVWQREVAEPGEYAALWLRDAGERPGTARWQSGYDRWLDWFAEHRVAAVGMGLINLRRTGAGPGRVVCEDVRQPVQQPSGDAIGQWFDRAAWLREHTDRDLLTATVQAAPDLVLQTGAVLDPAGWQSVRCTVRQSHGLRWELEVDEAVAGLIAGCANPAPLQPRLELLAAATGASLAAVGDALLPVLRDLIERGFLLPVAGNTVATSRVPDPVVD